jgi:hypothetical protein
MAPERHSGGLPLRETPSHVSAAGAALGLLLSRALSSGLLGSIIDPTTAESRAVFLQQVVDGEVLLHQRQATPQGVGGLLGCEPLEAAMPDPIVLTEITVNSLQAVVGLAGDDVGLFPFGVTLPANDSLMSKSCPHVVERGSPRDDGLGVSLMLGQQDRDPTVAGMEQLGQVAVGEESSLLVGLFAQAQSLLQQPLVGRKAVDAPLHILGGGELEQNRGQVDIGDALATSGWVVDRDGHPEHLPMEQVVFRSHMLEDNFKYHICAQLADTPSSDSREFLDDPVGQRVPQGLVAEWAEFLADEVGFATHGRPSHE